MLTAVLIAVAVVAGLAGAWSPCGLSMVDTLAPHACDGRRRTSVAGAVAFALGALGGGVVTFGGLALLGDALGAGGAAAAAVAVAALLLAAAGDAAGRRIVPQVRRQVPESWRRILPVPLAAGLYGVLLGLGFTTFVLSFATWGLAAACLAVGSPATGALVGLAFGGGRAVPVGLLAPLQDRDLPAAIAEAMGERPVVLRGLRAAAATGLAAAAVALVVAPPAARAAATVTALNAADPSAAPGLLAYHQPFANGILIRNGATVPLPGTHPAVSPTRIAWLQDENVVIADAATLAVVATLPAPGATALGLSDRFVAWRAPAPNGRDGIFAHDLATGPEVPAVLVGTARTGGTLGRPTMDGGRVVFDSQAPSLSRIIIRDLDTGALTVARTERGAQVLNPTIVDGKLLYVYDGPTRQRLILGKRVLYSTTPTARRDDGHGEGKHDHHQGYPHGKRPKKPARPPRGLTVTLWTTASDGATAYVTRLRHRSGSRTETRILQVPLS